MNQQKDITRLIYEETSRRLTVMKQPEYVFPDSAKKKDVIGIITAICVCTLLILGCMTGVII